MKKRIYLICLAALMTVAAGAFSGCSISAGDVAGIMNNANNANKETDASELTLAIKTLYSGVASGTVNSSTPSGELHNLSASKLPAPTATANDKKTAANKLTVQDAVDYQGLNSKFSASTIGDFGYSTSDGSVYYKATYQNTGSALKDLTMSTTIGAIRGS